MLVYRGKKNVMIRTSYFKNFLFKLLGNDKTRDNKNGIYNWTILRIKNREKEELYNGESFCLHFYFMISWVMELLYKFVYKLKFRENIVCVLLEEDNLQILSFFFLPGWLVEVACDPAGVHTRVHGRNKKWKKESKREKRICCAYVCVYVTN